MKAVRKLVRFTTIYGINRSINKAFGRLRKPYIKKIYLSLSSNKRNVSVIGAGQFAFSCISYFIAKGKGNIFLDCYDIDKKNQDSLANYYKVKGVQDVKNLYNNHDLEILYIASNHSTHTYYAVKAMEHGIKQVYIEKPLSTTYEQFVDLISTQKKNGTTLYVGYNRPYSKAIQQLKEKVDSLENEKKQGAFSLNYFISGHLIPDDHWYRNPEEGTRICGNMGHWLDLTIHIFAWRSLPNSLDIQITYANKAEFDDNIIINLSSDLGDIVSITLTARSEPFEGINESFNFQYADIISKVDDFRKMTVWQGSKLTKKRYFPKDVGHKRAVLQPFYSSKENRDWQEVIVSTLLMLHITDMVRRQQIQSHFDINKTIEEFNLQVKNLN